MFYLTQDHRSINLLNYHEVAFKASPEILKSKVPTVGTIPGSPQLSMEVVSNVVDMVGITTKRSFGKTKESSVILDSLTPITILRQLPVLQSIGLSMIEKVTLSACSVYPTRSTPDSWYKEMGLNPQHRVQEETPENILRKSPTFTVDLVVVLRSRFDTNPLILVSRNLPIGAAARLLLSSNAAERLGNRVSHHVQLSDFEQVLGKDEMSFYIKEEYHRLMSPKK